MSKKEVTEDRHGRPPATHIRKSNQIAGTGENANVGGYQTPVKKKKCGSPSKLLRRRPDGSPMIPRDETRPTKIIYLIRHGQSQGQAATSYGLDRKSSPELLDCGLSTSGESQARDISKHRFTQAELDDIELVKS